MSFGRFRESAAVFILAGMLLSGCTQSGGSKNPAPTPPSPPVLSAMEIHSTLTGNSWSFKGPRNTGTTLYAADGTSLVEVDGKGTAKGKWTTKDGQLCESFGATPWLPGGVPMNCYPFTRGPAPETYQAGPAIFTKVS